LADRVGVGLGEPAGDLAGASLRGPRADSTRPVRDAVHDAVEPMGATFGSMRTLAVKRRLGPPGRSASAGLLTAAERADGREPLSDQQRLDLEAGGAGFAAIVASEDDSALGLAVVSHGNESSTIAVVIDPARRDEFASLGAELLGAARDVV